MLPTSNDLAVTPFVEKVATKNYRLVQHSKIKDVLDYPKASDYQADAQPTEAV